MPVPHREPVERENANFVAGWNMPGYLPEMGPVFFTEFDDAKRFVLNAMGEHADDVACGGDDETAETIEAIRQDCNLESGPFCTDTVDQYRYWVEPVENTELRELGL